MIGVDTNVVVRLLVEDDADQTSRAVALVQRCLSRGESIFVSDVVLVEAAWVLRSVYRFDRARIVEALFALLTSREIEVRSRDLASRALDAYAAGRGDLADYLVRERGRDANAAPLYTFDRAVQGEDGFAAV